MGESESLVHSVPSGGPDDRVISTEQSGFLVLKVRERKDRHAFGSLSLSPWNPDVSVLFTSEVVETASSC